MDFSDINVWSFIIQMGIIMGSLLIANFMRNISPAIKKTLMPVAVIAGFILLALKYIFRGYGIEMINGPLYEMFVYHAIALGFIAMSLRTTDEADKSGGKLLGVKSGAIIVSTYLVQGMIGLAISRFIVFTAHSISALCCSVLLFSVKTVISFSLYKSIVTLIQPVVKSYFSVFSQSILHKNLHLHLLATL